MIYPEGDAIKERITNRYSLVVLAAKRARQLKEGAPHLIETNSANCLTIALEEIAAGKIDFIEGVEIRQDDESSRRDMTDPAAALDDSFLAPSEAPAEKPIREELAAFMDIPSAISTNDDEMAAEDGEDETDLDSDDEIDGRTEIDEDESSEPTEEVEA